MPPPHTVATLKACLSKAEGALGRSFQLFEDLGGEITMEDDDIITFLTDGYPGACEEEPMAVVYSKRRRRPGKVFDEDEVLRIMGDRGVVGLDYGIFSNYDRYDLRN